MGRRSKLLSQPALSQRELDRIAQVLLAARAAEDQKADGEPWPKTITEWCAYRRIGRTSWYRWGKLGMPRPAVIQPAGFKGVGLITREADAAFMRVSAALPAETNTTST
jgi:hypothetical protein